MTNPSKGILRLVERLLPAHLVEGIIGDLLEEYAVNLESKGKLKSSFQFYWTLLRFLHPYLLLKNRKVKSNYHMSTFISHFKTSGRNLLKHRFFSLLNLIGLSGGLAVVLLSVIFISSEFNFDTFHQNGQLIHRLYNYQIDLTTEEEIDGTKSAITPVPLGPDLKASIPDIRHMSRFGSNSATIELNENVFEETITMVDEAFFQMFDFPIISGNSSSPLSQLNAIVLSQDKANSYFGIENPIGQTLQIGLRDSLITFSVAAVVDNMQNSSSVPFDFVIPFEMMEVVVPDMNTYKFAFVENWVMLDKQPGVDFEDKLNLAHAKHNLTKGDKQWKIGLQPLENVHLNTDIMGLANQTDKSRLWIFSGLALLILMIVVINFVTSSTGQSLSRLKEILLRKTLGAARINLVINLYFEVLSFVAIATMLALGTAYFSLPYFNHLLSTTLTLAITVEQATYVFIVILSITILCGTTQVSTLLTSQKKSAGSAFNQVLITAQFSISIFLIIAALVMRQQMNYMSEKSLGFDQEGLIEISLHTTDDRKSANQLVEQLKNELSTYPQVMAVGASMNSFKEPWTELAFAQQNGDPVKIHFNLVDPNYVETMNIKLVEGSGFTNLTDQSNQILINKKLVDLFGWKDPLAQQIPGKNFDKSHQIVGVFEDYHFSSLHQDIGPMILALNPGAIQSGITGLNTYVWPPNLYQLIARVDLNNIDQSLNILASNWGQLNTGKPFAYRFIDDTIAQQYANEKKWGEAMNYASLFTIITAWMGLIGLIRLYLQQKTKEIGIRKVMGSGPIQLGSLLIRRYLIMFGIAVMLAIPTVYWFLGIWLSNFAYRVEISWLLVIGSCMSIVVLILASVGTQIIKATRQNPIHSLRYE
ncbi:MAG: ABC transporter permease [Cyclobacteriaceae bacterium]